VKTSNIKTILVWDLEAPSVWGTCVAKMIHVNIFLLCYLNEVSWTDVFAQIPLVG